jgi:plastocyanin
MRPVFATVPVLALATAVGLSACGSDRAAPPVSAACTSPTNGAVVVVAKNLQFQQRCLEVTAGQSFKLRFDNKDSGTPHDWVLKGAGDDIGTDLVSGPKTTEITVPALKAGSYTFVCTVHPNMSGTVKVAAASGTVSTLPAG